MKKTLLVIATAAALIGCQKSSDQIDQAAPTIQSLPVIPSGYTLPNYVIPTETAIMAGQTINAGTITVWNDETNVYVYYHTSGSYLLGQTHLYVGSCSTIPVNNAGNPRIGLYPYQVNHGGIADYTYVIPRSSLPAGVLCVSAHAVVTGPNFNETGWGFGSEINDGGSWAMKFEYTPQDGGGEEPPR